ncbi:MAG: energy transducer TonB [Bacteroidota bacterium]
MKHTTLIFVGLLFFNFSLIGQTEEKASEASKPAEKQEFIYAEKEPQVLNMGDVAAKIEYPQLARDAGIEGIVIVRVLVDEEGNYEKHKFIEKIHPILSDQVEAHVHELKFSPALQDGKPIKFWVNIPFGFKLTKKKKKLFKRN